MDTRGVTESSEWYRFGESHGEDRAELLSLADRGTGLRAIKEVCLGDEVRSVCRDNVEVRGELFGGEGGKGIWAAKRLASSKPVPSKANEGFSDCKHGSA